MNDDEEAKDKMLTLLVKKNNDVMNKAAELISYDDNR